MRDDQAALATMSCRQEASGTRPVSSTRIKVTTDFTSRVYLADAYWDIPLCRKVGMAKTLIDVDEQYLAAAQSALRTKTKKDTVNAALREVAALAARRRDLQRLISGGMPDLLDDDVMGAAWRQ
jgi:Arc/MetJ family transcription regulator